MSGTFCQNGLTAPEGDIGRREVLQAVVLAAVIFVIDEGADLPPEIVGQMVVFQQAKEDPQRPHWGASSAHVL